MQDHQINGDLEPGAARSRATRCRAVAANTLQPFGRAKSLLNDSKLLRFHSVPMMDACTLLSADSCDIPVRCLPCTRHYCVRSSQPGSSGIAFHRHIGPSIRKRRTQITDEAALLDGNPCKIQLGRSQHAIEGRSSLSVSHPGMRLE